MERVADELKIAKGTLYLYFPGKRELFFACVDYGMKELQTSVETAANTASDCFALDARSPWKSALTDCAASDTAEASICNCAPFPAGGLTV